MCKELRADAKVRDAATKKLDSKILAIVTRDIVAAEAHYQRSCYRQYTMIHGMLSRVMLTRIKRKMSMM